MRTSLGKPQLALYVVPLAHAPGRDIVLALAQSLERVAVVEHASASCSAS